MARFKPVHRGLKLLPVDFDKPLQPGSSASTGYDPEADRAAWEAETLKDRQEECS